MKRVLTVLLLAGLATVLAGCDVSVTNTDRPDPVKLGKNITYTMDTNVDETEEPTMMLEQSDSGVTEEEARAAASKAFEGSGSKAREFFPIKPYEEGDGPPIPLVILEDTYAASVNPVYVRPGGQIPDNAICGIEKGLRTVFCAFNPFAVEEEGPDAFPDIELAVKTLKAGEVKNTARVNIGFFVQPSDPNEEAYIIENENRPGFPEYVPTETYEDPDAENNVAVAVTKVVAPPKPDPEPSGDACTIKGTNGNDFLNGTPERDVICGLGGNDRIRGLGGNDLIRGGSGDDNLYGNAGDDTIFGQDGNDYLNGGSGDNDLDGGPGRNRLIP